MTQGEMGKNRNFQKATNLSDFFVPKIFSYIFGALYAAHSAVELLGFFLNTIQLQTEIFGLALLTTCPAQP